MAETPTRGLQRSEHRLLLLAGDTAAAAIAALASLWIWSLTTGFPFDVAFVVRWAAFFALVPAWVLLLTPSRRLRVALSIEATWRALLIAGATVAGAYLLAYFYAPPSLLPRLPALYFLWEAGLLTLAWRLSYLFAAQRGALRRRALILGSGDAAAQMASLIRDHAPDVELAGDAASSAAGELETTVRSRGISEIVLATPGPLSAETMQALVRCQELGVDIVPLAVEYEQRLLRVPIEHLPPDWMFTSLPEWVRTRDASRLAKRLVDMLGAAAGLVLLLIVLPFVALLIGLDSGRPIFYRQRRVGAGGREFDVIKFRTMVRGAEAEGPRWASADDPRATRVGRWLRRSRLDELPQVLNILRGEMSIVGPRPERPEFVTELEREVPFYRARLMVRPGLTGWAQVNQRYGGSMDDAARKLEYDLYYIKHRSFLFDAWIVLRTVGTVFRMGGR